MDFLSIYYRIDFYWIYIVESILNNHIYKGKNASEEVVFRMKSQ